MNRGVRGGRGAVTLSEQQSPSYVSIILFGPDGNAEVLCFKAPIPLRRIIELMARVTDDACPDVAAGDGHSPLSTPVNQFTVSLFHRLAAAAGQVNVFVSPLSVSTALSMLMLGAKSQSLDQLHNGMRFHLVDDKKEGVIHSHFQKVIEKRFNADASLVLANYLLIQKEGAGNEVLQKYKSDLQSLYSAKLDDVDFGSEGTKIQSIVNEWVKEKTKGLIDSILSQPPSPNTRLILLNAIYFKGKWEKPFDKHLTQKMPFFNIGVNEVETDFMRKYQKSFSYSIGEVGGEKSQMVELPYEDKTTSMIIILPDKRDGLKSMLANDNFLSDVSKVVASDSGITFQKTKLDFLLPKFKFETDYELNETLTDMGISDIFNSNADLSGITGSKDLLVSLVKHKAFVKVDEEGTEAAAVTAVLMMRCAMVQMERIVFQADHPFLFVIKDKKTGLALFIGKVETF